MMRTAVEQNDDYPSFKVAVSWLNKNCTWEKLPHGELSSIKLNNFHPEVNCSVYVLKDENNDCMGAAGVWRTEAGNFCVEEYCIPHDSSSRNIPRNLQQVEQALAEALLQHDLRATRVIHRPIGLFGIQKPIDVVVERVMKGLDFSNYKQIMKKHQPRLSVESLQYVENFLTEMQVSAEVIALFKHFFEQLSAIDQVNFECFFGEKGQLMPLLRQYPNDMEFWKNYFSKCFYLHSDLSQSLTLEAIAPSAFKIATTANELFDVIKNESDIVQRMTMLVWQDTQNNQPALFSENMIHAIEQEDETVKEALRTFRNRDDCTALAYWAKHMTRETGDVFFKILEQYPLDQRASALKIKIKDHDTPLWSIRLINNRSYDLSCLNKTEKTNWVIRLLDMLPPENQLGILSDIFSFSGTLKVFEEVDIFAILSKYTQPEDYVQTISSIKLGNYSVQYHSSNDLQLPILYALISTPKGVRTLYEQCPESQREALKIALETPVACRCTKYDYRASADYDYTTALRVAAKNSTAIEACLSYFYGDDQNEWIRVMRLTEAPIQISFLKKLDYAKQLELLKSDIVINYSIDYFYDDIQPDDQFDVLMASNGRFADVMIEHQSPIEDLMALLQRLDEAQRRQLFMLPRYTERSFFSIDESKKTYFIERLYSNHSRDFLKNETHRSALTGRLEALNEADRTALFSTKAGCRMFINLYVYSEQGRDRQYSIESFKKYFSLVPASCQLNVMQEECAQQSRPQMTLELFLDFSASFTKAQDQWAYCIKLSNVNYFMQALSNDHAFAWTLYQQYAVYNEEIVACISQHMLPLLRSNSPQKVGLALKLIEAVPKEKRLNWLEKYPLYFSHDGSSMYWQLLAKLPEAYRYQYLFISQGGRLSYHLLQSTDLEQLFALLPKKDQKNAWNHCHHYFDSALLKPIEEKYGLSTSSAQPIGVPSQEGIHTNMREEDNHGNNSGKAESFNATLSKFDGLVQDIGKLCDRTDVYHEHQTALKILVKSLSNAKNEFLQAPNAQTVRSFRIQCDSAISDAKKAFSEEPGLWRNDVMPLINDIITALQAVMRFFGIPQQYQPGLFKSSTVMEDIFEDSKLEIGVKTTLEELKGDVSRCST